MKVMVRSFKWPRRPTSVAQVRLLGEDRFGRWLGVTNGDRWWRADGSRSGTFEAPLVKVVPRNTFWTACFHPRNLNGPVVDVDIVLPVSWMENILEEVDLELDILRYGDGRVEIRDRELFDRVRATENMPSAIADQAEATCQQARAWVTQGSEPFGTVGQAWLARFRGEIDENSRE